MLTLHDVCKSRYLLHRNLVDCGFPAARASAAVDVLLDPEADVEAATFEPSEEDFDDYESWSDRMDRESFRFGDRPDYLSDLDILVATGCVG